MVSPRDSTTTDYLSRRLDFPAPLQKLNKEPNQSNEENAGDNMELYGGSNLESDPPIDAVPPIEAGYSWV